MQISNFLAQGIYPERESGRFARPGSSAGVEGQAPRRIPSPVHDGEAFASQAVPATEASALLPPPTPPTQEQRMDEILVRGRLMDGAARSLSMQRAIAHYAEVATLPDVIHLTEVLGVDAYA